MAPFFCPIAGVWQQFWRNNKQKGLRSCSTKVKEGLCRYFGTRYKSDMALGCVMLQYRVVVIMKSDGYDCIHRFEQCNLLIAISSGTSPFLNFNGLTTLCSVGLKLIILILKCMYSLSYAGASLGIKQDWCQFFLPLKVLRVKT